MSSQKKILGILGGMGPLATVRFMEILIARTQANCDQDHLPVILYQRPDIPDRTSYICGESDKSPLPFLLDGVRYLQKDVDVIAMPCITAHYFYKELAEFAKIPVISLVEETVRILKNRKIHTAGIMAADGTVLSGLFQEEGKRQGVSIVLPDEKRQAIVQQLIFEQVKKGGEIDATLFYQVDAYLRDKGSEAVVLGCTELSLIHKCGVLEDSLIDVLDVLALACLEQCQIPIRELREV